MASGKNSFVNIFEQSFGVSTFLLLNKLIPLKYTLSSKLESVQNLFIFFLN